MGVEQRRCGNLAFEEIVEVVGDTVTAAGLFCSEDPRLLVRRDVRGCRVVQQKIAIDKNRETIVAKADGDVVPRVCLEFTATQLKRLTVGLQTNPDFAIFDEDRQVPAIIKVLRIFGY